MSIKIRKILLLLLLAPVFAMGQSTFNSVYTLLQTNCSGSGCHDGNTPNIFSVMGTEGDVYNSLVNKNPENATALAKGDKLVAPGYVGRSFLLRKIAHGIIGVSDHLALTQPQEGSPMPDSLWALENYEIELVRQWILYGAPLTGIVIDTALINSYYRGNGIDDTYPVHTPPVPGTGFQIYVGKIFVPASTEIYYYIKQNLRLPSAIEIPKVNTMMPVSAHHFVTYKFLPGGSSGYSEGLRFEAQSSHNDVSEGFGTSPGFYEYSLPPNTAYFWEQSTVLDLNLHIQNTSPDKVLGTDLYMNVYTQPLGTAQKYMLIKAYPITTIAIPPGGHEVEFIEISKDTAETKMWNIWMLYGHTHEYGTDYDIFKRNPDGTMGSQVYDSWMSYEQGFNVGYHRYGVDGTVEFFPDDALLEVDPRLGFIHRARYKNTSQDTVFWGLTSAEMMVMGFQYIYGDDLTPLSASDINSETIKVNVFPNPASDAVSLNYILKKNSDIRIELINVLGEMALAIEQKNKPAGNYFEDIELNKQYPPGIYLLTFKTEYSSAVAKIVIE